jgi:hypothetical protein
MAEIETPAELSRAYALTDEQIRRYRQHGHIKLKHVLSPQALAQYGGEIVRVVRNTPAKMLISAEHRQLLDAEAEVRSGHVAAGRERR